jgi:hypothetical protein
MEAVLERPPEQTGGMGEKIARKLYPEITYGTKCMGFFPRRFFPRVKDLRLLG